MSQIDIVTAHNVTLKVEVANIGDRFLAAILDVLVKFGLTFLVSFIFTVPGARTLYGLLLIILWCGYSLIFELVMRGQSPGKRLMKIRVAQLDGSPLTTGSIITRWLFRMIDFPLSMIPTAGICTIVLSKRNQRLGDLVANTVIVSTKERTSLSETFFTEVGEGYIPAFPQAEHLTSREAEIIKEVFYQYQQHDKYELITLTAAKVKAFLQVNTSLDDSTFLKTVLKDYNHAGSVANDKRFAPKESFSYNL